ncbi:phage portal protein [Parvularcula sp. IMCC14364]|uniref:phage portal protein n=1 Tax=Parvularcula sp. IMCC14364 TaxID=3067902 RepID=UPI00274230B5|nr:phage portal protein [Parvularcula sp. IMCC14364]
MNNLWTQIKSALATATPQMAEAKASQTGPLIALHAAGQPVWTPRDYQALARTGYMRNVIAYRCIRMISEAVASVPLCLRDAKGPLCEHTLQRVLAQPNPAQSGAELIEELTGYLQTSGNAYLEAVRIEGDVRELYALRPDRMKIRAGRDGWPAGYEYEVAGRKSVFTPLSDGFLPVLHLKLFHPLHDHYGFAPLEAAATAIDIHNAAGSWNKALLDNAARPSGALVYKGPEGAGNLTPEQFAQLKAELEAGWQGRDNAGRPLVLDGGLDWKQMSLSPADMDFMNLRHGAARDIALAFGVPPQLLGIPGDNTYANYREANIAFWRQTVMPLSHKLSAALTGWLCPARTSLQIASDASQMDALSPGADQRLGHILEADFLTVAEKRLALGYPATPPEDDQTGYHQ